MFTTVQANRLAEENVTRGLGETRQVWETFQADRYNKLQLGIPLTVLFQLARVLEINAATLVTRTLEELNRG